jgi:hypothetical protein
MKHAWFVGLRHAARISAVALVATSTGCGVKYVAIESRLVESNRQATPELTPTAQYQAALPTIKRVAVRAPDSCTSLTAAQRTGSAAGTGTVVATQCGVEMAELERGLTRAGFIVSSWRTLENMVVVDRVTPTAAAAKLGAQVLFQVNSLERVQVRAGQDARWERHYFGADACGVSLAPKEFDEQDLASIRQLVAAQEQLILSRPRLGAMLDVNAVMVETGQTIWFYRWVKADSSSTERMARAVTTKVKQTWQPVSLACQPKAKPTKVVKSGESEAVSVGALSASDIEAQYFQLIREVVADFVAHFSKGSAGPAKAP